MMGAEVILAKVLDLAITAVLAGYDKDKLVSEVNDRVKEGATLSEVRMWLSSKTDELRTQAENLIHQ